MGRFQQFFWLLVLGLLFAASVPAPESVFGSCRASRPGVEVGSKNARAFVAVPYDAPSRGGISYDGGALREYAYDAASMRAAGEKENGTGGGSAVFANFAEFLAAKGTANGARFIVSLSGQVLDASTIAISGPVNSAFGKVDYLLGNVTTGENAALSAGKGAFFEE